MSKGKILVIRGGAIGDFILTLPVLSALRAQFPDTEIEVLGYPHIVQLAVAGGLAHNVRPIESRPLAGFFARHGELDDGLADYFAGFALIISFLYDPDQIFQTNIARCSGAQFITGPHRPDETAGMHAARHFLKPLERLAIFDADSIPRLILAPGAVEAPVQPGRWLALHPGSGSESKNWPEGNWKALISLLGQRTDLNLLVVGGEAEGERFQRLADLVPPVRRRVLFNAPLVELGRSLTSCAAFVGHDSGITHLAAAVGLPGLVLWGGTREEIWRPPSRAMKIVRHPHGLGALPAEAVFQEVIGLVTSS